MRRSISTLALAFLFLNVPVAQAELTPEELAIICVKGSRESRAVASYYAKERKVPTNQIFQIDVTPGADLTQEEWQATRAAIRRWLGRSQLHGKVRCLVTVWDVPLRIRRSESDPEMAQLVRFLDEERLLRVARIAEYVDALNQIAGTEPDPSKALGPDASLDELKAALDAALNGAQVGAGKIEVDQEKQQALQELQTTYLRCLGLNMMAQSLARQVRAGAATNPELRSQFDSFRGRVLGLREGRAALEGTPASLSREPQLLALIEVSDGLFGSIAWIDEQKKTYAKNETYSSFDSELSLIAWDDYEKVRWQPNYLHHRFDTSSIRRYKPTYMVARIEAPTLLRTRQIIDEAIAVEKEGLKGKVYLDARGLAKADEAVATGSYKDYDRALLLTAELFKNHTEMEVVLDTQQSLFQEGDCPDAALYCGWYSLAKYIDAFEWVPGAVAYHMASSEATTLRKPESQVWCKRMLEDGVAATIGPAYEPYILAFPRPNEFFALLLSGKHTLVESYFRSNPFNSWTMLLVGDPLYSPFRAAPALKMDGLDEATKRLINGPPAVVAAATASGDSSESTTEQP